MRLFLWTQLNELLSLLHYAENNPDYFSSYLQAMYLQFLILMFVFLPLSARAQLVELSEDSRHTYKVGVEGFQDKYTEDTVQLVEHARFVSLMGEYEHSRNGFFTSVSLRGSYGQTDYKSVSGTIRGITQYEGEARALTGMRMPLMNIGGIEAVVPYIGIGLRYFNDRSKNERTNLGFFGYDRRIMQLYVPLGLKWQFKKWGYNFTTLGEYDHLLYGMVESRFQNFDPQANTLGNKQKKGYGLRGEIMIGQDYDDYSWEFGPFVRFWHIEDSEIDTIDAGPNAGTYIEPDNQRLQAGAALRISF